MDWPAFWKGFHQGFTMTAPYSLAAICGMLLIITLIRLDISPIYKHVDNIEQCQLYETKENAVYVLYE